jgi:hypothetical protein
MKASGISTKFQAPNSKQAPMIAIQNSKQKRSGNLVIEFWNLFGICNL